MKKQRQGVTAATILLLSSVVVFTKGQGIVSEFDEVKSRFWLRFSPIQNGFGVTGRTTLRSALKNFESSFQDVWRISIEQNLSATLVEWSDLNFDVPTNGFLIEQDSIPLPQQFWEDGGKIAQRLSYDISNMILNGTEVQERTIDVFQLDWARLAFANNAFLPFLQQANVDEGTGVFDGVEMVEFIAPREYEATTVLEPLGQLENHPVYLEFTPLQDKFGPDQFVHRAIDSYFRNVVVDVIRQEVEQQVEGSKVYTLSPGYFTGWYAAGSGITDDEGNFINQYTTNKPSIVTEFEYGYWLVWWYPMDNPLYIDSPVQWVLDTFQNQSFLPYLQALREEFGVQAFENVTQVEALDTFKTPTSMEPSKIPSISPTLTNHPTRRSSTAPKTIDPSISIPPSNHPVSPPTPLPETREIPTEISPDSQVPGSDMPSIHLPTEDLPIQGVVTTSGSHSFLCGSALLAVILSIWQQI